MNRQFEEDMQRVVEGSLSPDDAGEVHGAANVGEVLSLHNRLAELSSVEVEVAPWYLVAPHLAADPTRRRGRRVAAVSLVAGLILVPAVAEGIEAVAPEAVRDTVIDKITDVLPWDRDTPAVDDVPDRPDRPDTDAPVETEVPATVDSSRETDTPGDGARPPSDSVDPERPEAPVRPDSASTTDAPVRDRPTNRERDAARDRDIGSDETDSRDRPGDRPDAAERDSPTTSTARTDRPSETVVPTESPVLTDPLQPVEREGSSLPGDDVSERSDRGTDSTPGGGALSYGS